MTVMKYVVFLIGFVVMGVEILAGRLLAPMFGDSVVVWGSIIGSVLIALSIGYWLGGFIADKHYKSEFLIFAILGLAISTLCMKLLLTIPFTHALTASLITTFFPGFFAGLVMPFALKEKTQSLKTLGVSYGTLSSFSTIGSVCGTFTTLFFFLPFFGATKTMLILSLLSFITIGFLRPWAFLFLLGIPLLLVAHYQDVQETTNNSFYEGPIDVTIESPYGSVRIQDLEGTRHMIINGGAMSEMNISNPNQSLLYWDYLDCLEAGAKDAQNIYTIGLGAGVLQNRLASQGRNVVAVDINPVVVESAKKYFFLPSAVETRVADARVDITKDSAIYDAIILDVMHYENHTYTVPAHLLTVEFFSTLKERLTPMGPVLIHLPVDKEDELVLQVEKTLLEVFNGVSAKDCDHLQVIEASDALSSPLNEISAQILTDDKTLNPLK